MRPYCLSYWMEALKASRLWSTWGLSSLSIMTMSLSSRILKEIGMLLFPLITPCSLLSLLFLQSSSLLFSNSKGPLWCGESGKWLKTTIPTIQASRRRPTKPSSLSHLISQPSALSSLSNSSWHSCTQLSFLWLSLSSQSAFLLISFASVLSSSITQSGFQPMKLWMKKCTKSSLLLFSYMG